MGFVCLFAFACRLFILGAHHVKHGIALIPAYPGD